MLWVGIGIGFVIGVLAASKRPRSAKLEMKRLEREIAADNLKCAREERRAAALRVIANNTTEGARNEHAP